VIALSSRELTDRFANGEDNPRALLDRCLEAIEAREPQVKAWVCLDVDDARRTAEESSERWRAGRPLSRLDGIPIGVKDLIFTHNMPTEMNSPIFKGWRSGRDAASVWWLRKSGAVILGKTVTTEFGVGASGPTTNPHAPDRTPGGSSSGSAAAVAAGMVPITLGTQVMGSVIRPSSYCGVFGFKPSMGALNRGGIHGLVPSQAHLGTHAATLEDVWLSAAVIAATAGGDPGYGGLRGGLDLPQARAPKRLVWLKTKEWNECDPGTMAAFENVLEKLQRQGIVIVDADAAGDVREFEADFADWINVFMDIVCWEMRWPMGMYAEDGEHLIGERATGFYKRGLSMTQDQYVTALARRQRYRETFAAIGRKCDAVITPATIGPAPVGLKFTGSPAYNAMSSGLGVPAVSLPLTQVEGLPVGLQLIGNGQQDQDLMAVANWVVKNFTP
jgi:Asp-tRNA(Asn)/Glu-tRNA(Gln) amidotransferase A subunit family amidase